MLGFNVRNTVSPTLGRELAEAMRQAGKEAAQEMKAKLEAITEDWHSEPEFTAAADIIGGEILIRVTTREPIFNFVDKGTKRHRIPLTGRKRLRIRDKETGKVSYREFVNHPGIKARNYSKSVADEVLPSLPSRVAAKMRRGGFR